MTKPYRISVPVIVLSIISVLSIAFNLIQFFNRHTPDVKSNFDETSESIDSWLGDYIYNEFVPPNINQHYTIRVYKENDSYFADISVDGFQADDSYKTKAVGNSNCIRFFYASEIKKTGLFAITTSCYPSLRKTAKSKPFGKIFPVWKTTDTLKNSIPIIMAHGRLRNPVLKTVPIPAFPSETSSCSHRIGLFSTMSL